MDTAILHMDGDAFFVGVEVAKNPKLRGLPVVTGEERGIVSALSYEAKALGVTRGLPIFRLKKDFPSVIILPGDYKAYADYSSRMFDIVRRYTEDVEEYSIDECFADLTGLNHTLHLSYREIVAKIQQEIEDELDLSVSIGLAPTKCLAKVASKWQKPHGVTVIEKRTAQTFLDQTPIDKVWGIGRRTSVFLQRNSVQTAGDFVRKGSAWVLENMSKPYQVIWHELQSLPVMSIHAEPKKGYSSIQKTRTFWPPTSDPAFLLSQFSKHMEDVCKKARHYNLVPRSMYFYLKSQEFRYSGYGIDFESRTNTPEIPMAFIQQYFHTIYTPAVLYRAAGVTLSGLTPYEASQQDLFGDGQGTKFERIHERIDALEKKLGKRVVHLGSTHSALAHAVKGTDVEDMDRDLLFL